MCYVCMYVSPAARLTRANISRQSDEAALAPSSVSWEPYVVQCSVALLLLASPAIAERNADGRHDPRHVNIARSVLLVAAESRPRHVNIARPWMGLGSHQQHRARDHRAWRARGLGPGAARARRCGVGSRRAGASPAAIVGPVRQVFFCFYKPVVPDLL
jgi:hypothetical protein